MDKKHEIVAMLYNTCLQQLLRDWEKGLVSGGTGRNRMKYSDKDLELLSEEAKRMAQVFYLTYTHLRDDI